MTTPKTLSLDKLLLTKGLVDCYQLTQALEYQCNLGPGKTLSLCEVLLELKFVTQAQIETLSKTFPSLPPEDPLTQILLHEQAIDAEQLTQALAEIHYYPAPKRMGTILLELNYISREIIERALQNYYRRKREALLALLDEEVSDALPVMESQGQISDPLGQILIAKGYISEQDLDDAIDYQYRLPRTLYKPLGSILVELGYLSQTQLEEALQAQPEPIIDPLGQVLLKRGVLQAWQLSHALSLKYRPEHAHKKLGFLLVELGYASQGDIEQAVRAHFTAT